MLLSRQSETNRIAPKWQAASIQKNTVRRSSENQTFSAETSSSIVLHHELNVLFKADANRKNCLKPEILKVRIEMDKKLGRKEIRADHSGKTWKEKMVLVKLKKLRPRR